MERLRAKNISCIFSVYSIQVLIIVIILVCGFSVSIYIFIIFQITFLLFHQRSRNAFYNNGARDYSFIQGIFWWNTKT